MPVSQTVHGNSSPADISLMCNCDSGFKRQLKSCCFREIFSRASEFLVVRHCWRHERLTSSRGFAGNETRLRGRLTQSLLECCFETDRPVSANDAQNAASSRRPPSTPTLSRAILVEAPQSSPCTAVSQLVERLTGHGS